MKTRFLIIIGIAVAIVVAIGLSLTVILQTSDYSPPENSHFNYKYTEQIISDTYLDKTVSDWQKESHESLMSYHAIHGDQFFKDLGALIIKNEMLRKLHEKNISLSNPDFEVYPGMMLTSLPPHVSFEAFVNDTDNSVYRVSGMTQSAYVGDVGITKLEFFDVSKNLPLESILSQNNTVVLQQKGDDQIAVPHNLVVYGNQDIQIYFKNTFSVPIRIQGDGNWQNPDWYGPTILPFTTGHMTFENPGVYEWHARTLPLPGSIASDHMGGGEILIISDNVNNATFQEKQKIGAAILKNSEIPWSGMGSGNNRGIILDFNRAITDALPNYREYYQARAEQLIPFDVPVIIEDPYRTE